MQFSIQDVDHTYLVVHKVAPIVIFCCNFLLDLSDSSVYSFTCAEGGDGLDSPAALTALILNSYSDPVTSPVTV